MQERLVFLLDCIMTLKFLYLLCECWKTRSESARCLGLGWFQISALPNIVIKDVKMVTAAAMLDA